MESGFEHNALAEPQNACLDVCELVTLGETPAAQRAALEELLQRPGLEGCARIYAGSSFCPQVLFSARSLLNAVFECAAQRQLKVTLTLPIIAQRFWENAQAGIEALLEAGEGVVDEVAVNDFGTLDFVCELVRSESLPLRINLGRLLSKDTREPRDPYYPHQTYAPKLFDLDEAGVSNFDRIRTTWSYWNEETNAYDCLIGGVELDPTHDALDLSLVPAGVSVAVHGPLCYVSTGQICEFAAIGRQASHAFRPNERCANQCQHGASAYRDVDGVDYLKVGRTVYVEAAQPAVCAPSYLEVRTLVSPLKEVLAL